MSIESFKESLQSTRLYRFKPVAMSYEEWRSIVTVAYVGVCGDLFHAGHLNIIQMAKVYSQIIVVGVLTDEAICSYKRLPITKFEERYRIISQIEHVDLVIHQKTLSYQENLRLVKPNYLFHGSDWQTGDQQNTRTEALSTLQEFDGTLIEPDCYEGVSTTQIINKIQAREK